MSRRIKTYQLIILFLYSFAHTGEAKNTFQDNETKLNVVIIDPGHGGKDFGASVDGLKEKDIVLDIALKIGSYITEAYPDVKVIYTRTKDIFIPLNERARIANKNKADLFISIHANYVGVKSVSGTETFVLGNHRIEDNLEIEKKENSVILLEDNYIITYEGFDPNSSESYIMFETVQSEYLGQSLQFASFIQDQFKNKAKRADRGVKQAGFLVLRETTMPSVLIETGFLSNANERSYIASEAGKANLASAVFKAFSNYKNIIEEKSTFNVTSETNARKENSDSSETNINKRDTSQIMVKEYSNLREKETMDPQTDGSNIKPSGHLEVKKEILNEANSSPGQLSGVNSDDSINAIKNSYKIKNKTDHPETLKTAAKNTVVNSGNDKVPDIWFTVQVAVTAKLVKLIPDNFKGEDGIFNMKIGPDYKYYKGKFGNYEIAAYEKTRLRNKFNDAFVVAFENGLPIPIKEAIQKTSK